jgi:hypothetical protein
MAEPESLVENDVKKYAIRSRVSEPLEMIKKIEPGSKLVEIKHRLKS